MMNLIAGVVAFLIVVFIALLCFEFLMWVVKLW